MKAIIRRIRFCNDCPFVIRTNSIDAENPTTIVAKLSCWGKEYPFTLFRSGGHPSVSFAQQLKFPEIVPPSCCPLEDISEEDKHIGEQ